MSQTLEQHFGKLIDWLQPLLQAHGQHIAWLTGSQNKGQRTQALAGIHDGRAALVVGTHAVIGEQVQFARLGLALIDEQHRFGVAQRLAVQRIVGGEYIVAILVEQRDVHVQTVAVFLLCDVLDALRKMNVGGYGQLVFGMEGCIINSSVATGQ